MKINPDTCTDPSLLAREVRRLQSLLDEIRAAADQADVEYRAEIASLRDAIRRLAEQDATLSVCEGNVTVTIDAPLTDAEREAVERVSVVYDLLPTKGAQQVSATLRGLLKRLSPPTT